MFNFGNKKPDKTWIFSVADSSFVRAVAVVLKKFHGFSFSGWGVAYDDGSTIEFHLCLYIISKLVPTPFDFHSFSPFRRNVILDDGSVI